jgi:hypothetical protein
MATMKSDLQKEIDTDVAAEAALRVEEDGKLAQAIKNEEDRAKGIEQNHEGRIAANEAFVTAQPAIDAEQNRRLGVLEGKFEGENSVANQIKAVADALAAHETAATTKNNDQDSKIGALEGRATAVEGRATQLEADVVRIDAKDAAQDGRLDALEQFKNGHSHAVMEQGIADNKAAIEKEVGDRNAAIAKALEDYTTSDDMMSILGNIVNSLALSMEDNKMVLKLGGVDGVEIHSTSLDMATEDDIDAIIAGLDQQQQN